MEPPPGIKVTCKQKSTDGRVVGNGLISSLIFSVFPHLFSLLSVFPSDPFSPLSSRELPSAWHPPPGRSMAPETHAGGCVPAPTAEARGRHGQAAAMEARAGVACSAGGSRGAGGSRPVGRQGLTACTAAGP